MFARLGIPEEVKSYNGPQYASKEFQQFAKIWKFNYTTSSPRYRRSNGLAERTVQTVKHLLSKTLNSWPVSRNARKQKHNRRWFCKSSTAPNESKPPIHDPFTTTAISTKSNRSRVFPTTTRTGATETENLLQSKFAQCRSTREGRMCKSKTGKVVETSCSRGEI